MAWRPLVLIFWMGVAPQPFLDRMQPSLDRVLLLVKERAVANATAAGIAPPAGLVIAPTAVATPEGEAR